MVANSELSYVPSSQLKILHILLFNVDVTVSIFKAKLREIEHIPQHHIVSGKKGLCADLADWTSPPLGQGLALPLAFVQPMR